MMKFFMVGMILWLAMHTRTSLAALITFHAANMDIDPLSSQTQQLVNDLNPQMLLTRQLAAKVEDTNSSWLTPTVMRSHMAVDQGLAKDRLVLDNAGASENSRLADDGGSMLISAVPVPAASWLFAYSVLWLVGQHKRQTTLAE